MKNVLFSAAALVIAAVFTGQAYAAGGSKYELMEPEGGWPHEGIFGRYDRAAAQRGMQIYREVCAACHSLDLVSFRTLSDIGFNEDQIKAIAAEYTVPDEPNEYGDIEERPGKPFDYFPSPFPNPQAAAFSNNGAVPPDLSLITKARVGGASYIYSLMLGYVEEPTEEQLHGLASGKVPEGAYYNKYMAGNVIAMAPPLFDDMVTYSEVEGQPDATLEQMSYDIATFLAWTAEPKLEERKELGFRFMLLLFVLCGLLFLSYRRISKRVLGH